MPNLPVAIRRGVVALFGADADSVRQPVADLFQPLGFAPWVSEEAKLAAVGSVAGAGPAYVARFIAALAKAGVDRGLDPTLADRLALETVLGTATMAAARGESMACLAERVASPSGTTEAGLEILDAELDPLIRRTLEAASRRGAELAAAARIDSGPALA